MYSAAVAAPGGLRYRAREAQDLTEIWDSFCETWRECQNKRKWVCACQRCLSARHVGRFILSSSAFEAASHTFQVQPRPSSMCRCASHPRLAHGYDEHRQWIQELLEEVVERENGSTIELLFQS